MASQLANGNRTAHQPCGSFPSSRMPFSKRWFPAAAGRCSCRRPPASSAAAPQHVQLAEGQSTEMMDHGDKSTCRGAAAWAASSLAAMLVVCPTQVLAEQLPDSSTLTTQDPQAVSILLPAGSLAANLSAPEAPALVSNSGEVLMQGVKGIVESGLQDLAANSMTAVGGPVTGDVLSASANQAADGTDAGTAQAQQQQQQQQPPKSQLPGVWCSAWQAYCDALEQSPLPTKVYTGVVGTLLGDLVAQILSHTGKQQQKGRNSSSSSSHDFQFDALRAGRLCLYSALVGTPMGHYWYALLESAVLPSTPLAPVAVAAKVLLDQLLQTPFGMLLFFSTMKVLEGQPREVHTELKSKVVPALLANWKLWPAAQLVNFTLIPEEQRVLYTNIIGICWTCVISNMQQASTQAASNANSPRAPAAAAASTTTATDFGTCSSLHTAQAQLNLTGCLRR